MPYKRPHERCEGTDNPCAYCALSRANTALRADNERLRAALQGIRFLTVGRPDLAGIAEVARAALAGKEGT